MKNACQESGALLIENNQEKKKTEKYVCWFTFD